MAIVAMEAAVKAWVANAGLQVVVEAALVTVRWRRGRPQLVLVRLLGRFPEQQRPSLGQKMDLALWLSALLGHEKTYGSLRRSTPALLRSRLRG